MHHSPVPKVFLSDTLVSEALQRKLTAEVDSLMEATPKEQWDWHPKHRNKLLHVTHPNQCFYIRGKSLLSHPLRRRLSRAAAAESQVQEALSVEDELIRSTPVPPTPVHESTSWQRVGVSPSVTWEEDAPPRIKQPFSSPTFQWLPTEVRVDAYGKATIQSTINHLNPIENAELYQTIAEVFECTLPLFEHTLSYLRLVKPHPAVGKDGKGTLLSMETYRETSSWLDSRS